MSVKSLHLLLKVRVQARRPRLLVDPPSHLIDHLHDEVVVLPAVPEPKDHARATQVVVLGLIAVIHLPHSTNQPPVHLLRQRNRVFGELIVQQPPLQMQINGLEICRAEMKAFGEPHQILEDLLAAVNFDVVVAELLVGKIKEGPRPDLLAEGRDEDLEGLLGKLVPGEGEGDAAITGLELTALFVALQGRLSTFPAEAEEFFEEPQHFSDLFFRSDPFHLPFSE